MVKLLTRSKIISFSAFCLIAIIVCNLNAVSSSVLGVKQVFSPLILVFSFIIITQTYSIRVWDWSIGAVFVFYLLHYPMGLVVRLFNEDIYVYRIPIKEVFFQCVTSLIIIFAFYKATIYFIRNDKFNTFLNFLLIAFSISLSIVAFCFFTGWNPVKGIAIEDRGGGFFANPNEAGTAANLGLTILMLKLMSDPKNNFIKFILLPIFILAAFTSFSKMAILISLLLIILFFIFFILKMRKIKSSNRNIIFLLLLITLFLIGSIYTNFDEVLTFLSPEQGRRIKGILLLVVEREINQNTTSERDIIAYIALELISLRPFFGYGFGFFQQGLDSSDHGVHNTHLQIIGETGIIIYVFYILSFVVLWIKALAAKNQGVTFIIILGTFTIFANNVASHNDLYNRIINAYVGIICGMAAHNKAQFKI